MPIDFKKTTLLESAFTPVAIPAIDSKTIQQSLYQGSLSTYATEVRGTIAETKIFSPEEKPALELFNKQIERLITIIENACKTLGVAQHLLDNLQTFSERFRARTYYEQQGVEFYIDVKKCLEKIAVCLLNVSPKDIEKKHVMINLLNVIHMCSSGTHGHINTATISLLTSDSMDAWLAIFRRTIIRSLADQYIKNKRISEGNSIHVHNVFLRYACEEGWNPYGFETGTIKEIHANLADITPEDLPVLHEAFFETYTPTAIMRELAAALTDRIFTRITDNILKEAKALEAKTLKNAKPPVLSGEEKKPSSSIQTTLSTKTPSEPLNYKSYFKVTTQGDLEKLFAGLPFFASESSLRTIFDVTEFTEEKTLDEKTKPAKSPPFVVYGEQKLTPKPISTLMIALTNYLITENNPLFETVSEENYTLVPGCPDVSYRRNPDDSSSPIPLLKRLLPSTCDSILVAENEPTIEDMKTNTLQLVHSEGRLTAFWIENTELVSHYFDESEVQDIIQKLPEIETISDDAELMEMVAAKYGSFQSDIDGSILKKHNISMPISNASFKRAYAYGKKDFSQDTLDGVDLTQYDINDFILTNNEAKGEVKKVTLYNVKVTPLQYLHLFNAKIPIKKLRYDEENIANEILDIFYVSPQGKGILLFFAIENNLNGLVKLLLESNADTNIINFNEGNKPKPIHIAAMKGQLGIVKVLLTYDLKLLEQADVYTQTPLIWAAAEGHGEVVDYLIQQKANLNATTISVGDAHHGKTALYWAVQNGHAPVVTSLILAGAITTTALDEAKHQPIHIAAGKGNLAIVKALIENDPDLIDKDDAYGETPLMWSAYKGHLAIVDYLLKKNANLNASTNRPGNNGHGRTALCWAVKNGQAKVVARLIQAGAATTIVLNDRPQPLLHIAVIKGDLAVVQAFVENLPPGLIDQTDANNKTALCLAIENGRADIVACLVKAGATTTIVLNGELQSLLHIAVIKGDLASVQAFVENVPLRVINQTGANGKTALYLATENGRADIVACLAKAGAATTIDLRPPQQYQPIHIAAMKGDVAVVDALIKNVSPEMLAVLVNYDKTALYLAVENGHAEVVASLVRAKATILAEFSEIENELVRAATRKGNVAVVKSFIENFPDQEKIYNLINQPDKNDDTLLMLAAKNGHLEVADYLIKMKANLNASTKHGKTALNYAIENGHANVVAGLLQAGASTLTTFGEEKYCPIHIAAMKGNVAVVKTLIENDPGSINQRDAYNQTPLMLAAAKGHLAVVDYLIKKKADLKPSTQKFKEQNHAKTAFDWITREKDKDHGKTVLDWAIENGHPAIVARLLAAGPPACQTLSYIKYHSMPLVAYKGNLEVVKKFVDYNPRLLDEIDRWGRTPFAWAMDQQYFELAYYFISKIPNSSVVECYKENFNKLYENLYIILGNYYRHLSTQNYYYSKHGLYKRKLAFIKNLQDRLRHNQNQSMEAKLQTVDEVYKLIATNDELEKHKSIPSMFFSQHMFMLYLTLIPVLGALTVFLISMVLAPIIIVFLSYLPIFVIGAAIKSKQKYNTVKFWKPEGYKQKEHLLSEITLFKNKIKSLDSIVRSQKQSSGMRIEMKV